MRCKALCDCSLDCKGKLKRIDDEWLECNMCKVPIHKDWDIWLMKYAIIDVHMSILRP